ncbi:MAG: hypothetical protein WAX69_11860 [Victivallales bacterium]
MKNIKLISLIFAIAASFLLSFTVNADTGGAKYVYDANNCLTKVVYSNDRTINFTYDNNGNLTNVSYSGVASVPIVVNTQPGYTPVEAGDSITLAISATGDGINTLSYQWKFSNDGGATWTNVGIDDPALTLNGLASGDQGLYKCVVSDGVNPSVDSATVRVYVLDAGISDFWTSTTYLAPGSRFSIYNFEVANITGDFTAKPKLLKGELVQPVAGVTKTYVLTLLTAPTLLLPKETLSCVWPTAVLLYNKLKLTSCYASGFYCADFLALYPQYDKDTYIVIQTATGTAQYLSRFFTLRPPEISKIRNSGDTDPDITSAGAGDTILIKGNYFGKKAPIAWLEYKVTGKPGVLKLLLKTVLPLKYADEKNVPAKSCMDLETGESEVKFLIPATLPATLIKGDNNIVIDNGQGLATFPFSIAP